MTKRRLGVALATSAVVLLTASIGVYFGAFDAAADFSCSDLRIPPIATEEALISEHVIGGLPALTDETCQEILARNAYVVCYNSEARIPEWAAYHVTTDYLNTPARDGRFQAFNRDPNVENPVVTSEYTGTYSARGYERGHLAPYNIAGGDRDGDLMYAVYPPDSSNNDPDDARTICEINYMSNIAPQHKEFNNTGGLWYKLERQIQDEWVEGEGRELWVIAGCVLGSGQMETVGKNNDIVVPPMFYKIVIEEQTASKVLAFLFPHQRESHGEIEDFLVSVDVIEALTGFDFFSGLEDESEYALEGRDTWLNWTSF